MKGPTEDLGRFCPTSSNLTTSELLKRYIVSVSCLDDDPSVPFQFNILLDLDPFIVLHFLQRYYKHASIKCHTSICIHLLKSISRDDSEHVILRTV